MAFVPMEEAVAGNPAYAAEYNNVVRNVRDLDARLGTAFTDVDTVSAWATSAQTSIDDHEARLDAIDAKPQCVLKKSANQSIPDGDSDGAGSDTGVGDIEVTWQTAVVDNAAMKSGDTIVIPSAGRYLVAAQVNIAPGGTRAGDCVLYVTKNGTTVHDKSIGAFGQPSANTGGLGNGLSLSSVQTFVAGDVLRVMVFQDSGIARDARATDFGGCTFAVIKL